MNFFVQFQIQALMEALQTENLEMKLPPYRQSGMGDQSGIAPSQSEGAIRLVFAFRAQAKANIKLAELPIQCYKI